MMNFIPKNKKVMYFLLSHKVILITSQLRKFKLTSLLSRLVINPLEGLVTQSYCLLI